MAAVLACGEGALLSHSSAAALWGLTRHSARAGGRVGDTGEARPGIAVHEGGISKRRSRGGCGIPVTSVARTLFDLAEVVDERAARSASSRRPTGCSLLRDAGARSGLRAGLRPTGARPIRRLIDEARAPDDTRSPLEDRFLALCREYDSPDAASPTSKCLATRSMPSGPRERLMVEADSFAFHGHRAAFERDRARDAAMQVEGYRVIRLTHRRLERRIRHKSPPSSAALLDTPQRRTCRRLEDHMGARSPARLAAYGGGCGVSGGQGTVEWVGLVAVVALLLVALVAAGCGCRGRRWRGRWPRGSSARRRWPTAVATSRR